VGALALDVPLALDPQGPKTKAAHFVANPRATPSLRYPYSLATGFGVFHAASSGGCIPAILSGKKRTFCDRAKPRIQRSCRLSAEDPASCGLQVLREVGPQHRQKARQMLRDHEVTIFQFFQQNFPSANAWIEINHQAIQSCARRRLLDSTCSGCTTLKCRVSASFLLKVFSSVQSGQ
jgi:hypothetical protein